ncbi:MAG: hypothetical protein EPN45_20465 [Rhizobiaceae bacterium]|nr:MAG: hypothetical protein EPN45_20465 [Rhizobiaceae bacterium]
MADASLLLFAPVAESGDPLLTAVNHYVFSYDAYGELPEDLDEKQDAAASERLLYRPQSILENWCVPATSMEGAQAALRLLLREMEQGYCEPLQLSLLKAALGYFEGRPIQ